MKEKIVYTNEVGATIDRLVEESGAKSVFTIVDVNTAAFCLPLLRETSKAVAASTVLTVKAGDAEKSLEAAAALWKSLSNGGATRSSMIVNVGGGVVTDLGGFVAATFKRGVPYINVPTTLLGAVDAATGGKTGINFNGLKNEVGAFALPAATVVSTVFFKTLPEHEMLSGYAEMLKHALLSGNEALARALSHDAADTDGLLALLRENIKVKTEIVASDPKEAGPRKALNLGHTAGHAFEALAMERRQPIPHGYAVAWGLIVELVLSHLALGYPTTHLYPVVQFVKAHYGSHPIVCDDYPRLLALMAHDKKNASPEEINFTLLRAPGEAEVNRTATAKDIETALDIYRDLTA